MTTTNYHIHTSKSKDRKKRNLMGSLIEQSQLVSINFDPPYSNEDSINEKIQMTKILGEHPLFFDISKNCVPKKQETDNFRSNTQKYVNFEGNLDVSNLSSNKSPLFKAIENTINYEDRLNKIFQKVKINPLIQKISDKFIEENNSDLNLSYTDDEGVNEIEVNITTMSDFVTYDKQRNEFSLSSLSRQRIEFFESPSSDSTISTEEPPKEKTSKSKTPLENKDLNDKIYFDKNGKPQLIVSIALDLLKDPTGILSLDAINGKKNLNLIKHKNENNENEQHMKLELKTLSDNNLKRSSSSLVGLSEANNKKLKTSDEGASILTNSNNYNAKIKQKNTYKSSTGSNDMIQANSIEIFKQMNTDNPPKLLKLNNIKRIIQNYDFLYKELSEEMFHKRGIAKKHEADTEKESQMKKVTLYMEAVCNFCLCAVTQHQFKKIKPDNSTNLLNDTWNLLKFINEKILRKTENAGFTKKFKVLSNWMESFIFHWLWKLKLIESKALSTALKIIIDSMVILCFPFCFSLNFNN